MCQNPKCGEVYFADPVSPNACPSCGKAHTFPFYIKTSSGYNVPAHERTVLYQCHTTDRPADDFHNVKGEMMVRGSDIGIKNLSKDKWSRIQGKEQDPVDPGRGAQLEKGVRIDFGNGAYMDIV